MDNDSIQALIDALKYFTGAVLLISHDRQAIKEIIEEKVSDRRDDESDRDSDSSYDDMDPSKGRRNGRTYLLKDGRMKLLERGVEDYIDKVERRMQRES